ncbi:MAG TPA: XrtA system polysaccharide chain length determinant [Stellaceae bacterium]|nr:XrtA system polysaccharide chain length determinant [Stellaceae bacterium]
MESLSGLIFQYLHAIWRRKWITALTAWAVCVVGWSVIAMLPNRYESYTRIYVDADQLLTPLLRGIAVDVDPARQLDVLQRTLLSRPNVEELIHMADLDRSIRTQADKDALIRRLMQQITIQPQTRNLFTISYQDSNPQAARNVVQSLLTIFAESTTGTQRTELDNAQRFLSDQIALYEKQLRAAEQRRAEFRTQHADVLNGSASSSSIDTMRHQLQTMHDDLQDATARRDELQRELDSLTPSVGADATAVGVSPGGAEQQLVQLERQLAALRTRYTDEYPDVIAVKQQIAALSGRIGTHGAATVGSKRTPGTRTKVSPVVYDQVRIRLLDAQGKLASLQRRVGQAQTDLQHAEDVAKASPGVEAQYQDLDRDYSILKRNYDELLSRREATNLSQAADTQADKIQFRVIDAPQVPTTPIAPNRPVLFSAVLLAGILGGLGIPVLLTQIDRSFATLNRLRGLGLPVLGGVSYVALFKSKSQSVMEMAGFSASAVALMMLYGVLILMTFNVHRALPGGLG